MTIKLVVEYDGSRFAGWQRQKGQLSIQETLEQTIKSLVGKQIHVFGAGRTDSGVHALGQVAHFRIEDSPIPPERWFLALNHALPTDIRIVQSRWVGDSFHAQKDAISKMYAYRVLNRSYGSALDRRVYLFPSPLDWDLMEEALPFFVGEHDFKSFQGAKSDVKTTVRTVTRFELQRSTSIPGLYSFIVEGSGFLKQMVRTMVGTVMEIGQGKRKLEDLPAVFAARDRRAAGRTAPPQGLFLVEVRYRDEVGHA